jgi:hypothetical protein
MGTESVAELIHLAVAPIFLLTAVATTLTLLANRLSRIVDRGRVLEQRGKQAEAELAIIERRAHLIYRAITLGVLSALFVCVFMSLAFAGGMLRFNAGRVVALLFVGALFSYTAALLCLLREVFLAIGSFRLGIHHHS